MDPEDLREVISAYQKCVTETVQRFGGFVAKYMGDGVLVYFGYPQAHEDDAERAVRAALEVVAGVGKHAGGSPNARRYCHRACSGWRPDRFGEARERGIVGETPTSPPVCKALPSRTRWSSLRVRENYLAVSSNCKISGPRSSRA